MVPLKYYVRWPKDDNAGFVLEALVTGGTICLFIALLWSPEFHHIAANTARGALIGGVAAVDGLAVAATCGWRIDLTATVISLVGAVAIMAAAVTWRVVGMKASEKRRLMATFELPEEMNTMPAEAHRVKT